MSQPILASHHWRKAATLDIPGFKRALAATEGFNSKLAVIVTHAVGTMACAYVFTGLALAGLPTALAPGGQGIVSWTAQTFIQLVLLSIIMVGQMVQSATADARAVQTYQDTERIIDLLDDHTAGGLKSVLDAIAGLNAKVDALAGHRS
jgi:hypothetical protein